MELLPLFKKNENDLTSFHQVGVMKMRILWPFWFSFCATQTCILRLTLLPFVQNLVRASPQVSQSLSTKPGQEDTLLSFQILVSVPVSPSRPCDRWPVWRGFLHLGTSHRLAEITLITVEPCSQPCLFVCLLFKNFLGASLAQGPVGTALAEHTVSLTQCLRKQFPWASQANPSSSFQQRPGPQGKAAQS